METKTMTELRNQLIEVRQQISKIVPAYAKYIEDATMAKTELKQAIARAKVVALQSAVTKAQQTPTMINAMADIDPAVMEAQKKYDLA